jgi:hypothetical protein
MQLFVAASIVAVLSLGATALATAAPGGDQSFTFGDAAVLGPVHVTGDTAQVHVRYSCDVGTHLWVSVKQSDTGAIDPAVAEEGSGFGDRGSFACDGKRHVAWFTVDTVEPGSRGELQNGFAWVQFCVTTDEDLSAVRMQWSRVVTND